MMMQTEAERARISETLVNLAGLQGFWSWCALEESLRPVFDGNDFRRHWSEFDAPWSSGQARMVGVAWGVWNDSHTTVGISDIVFGLDQELRAAIADLLLLPSSSEWLDKHRAGWRSERLTHYNVSRWEVPERGLSHPDDPYWLASGESAMLNGAQSAASALQGRVRVQRVSGLVEGPRALELVDDRHAC